MSLQILPPCPSNITAGPANRDRAIRGARERPLDEKAALDRLVVEHLPAALRFAVRLTGNADEAEDIVQDALLRVARGWAAFRGEANFRTWLFRIVVNAFRDRLRRPRMETLPDEVDDRRGEGPDRAALQRELGELVAQKVSSLPPRQREVLVLTMYEQLPPREVAGVLGISEASRFRALAQCRARRNARGRRIGRRLSAAHFHAAYWRHAAGDTVAVAGRGRGRCRFAEYGDALGSDGGRRRLTLVRTGRSCA